MWFVYLLLCDDCSFYTGSSSDPHQRYRDHCNGKGGRYTKLHKPIKLLYIEALLNKSVAIKRNFK